MSIRSLAKQILTGKENKRYDRLLAARQTSYEEWVTAQESCKEETAASPCFYSFYLSRGKVHPQALSKIERYFQDHPEVMVVYGDEDVLAEDGRKSPWFKPDWSPDLLDSYFYFGSLVALRKELVERMEQVEKICETSDRLCRVNDFVAFERWVHSCLEAAGAYQAGSKAVGHISQILFHCIDEAEQKQFLNTSAYCSELSKTSVDSMISVVIPSKDHPQILENCVKGCLKVLKNGCYIPCEILIVDNGSSEENRLKITDMLQRLEMEQEKAEKVSIQYFYQPMEFHFSKMCNLGAKKASGRFLLFLNDDVELCEPGSIGRMAALADRNYTGAVGMKLYYPESKRIQHAGITNLPMGPVHKLQFLTDDENYYFGYNRGLRNVVAVTGACLMVEREKFWIVGGFSEELPVAFNDVDLCFSLQEMGWWNVCINDSYAYHHESLSRGDDETPDKRRRLLEELEKLYRRHPKMENKDPFYSAFLNREGLDTRIRPAYETAGNVRQEIDHALVQKDSQKEMKEYREDPCVLLRVESCRAGVLQGYSVVLGDNNACYEKKLLLIKEKTEAAEDDDSVYTISVEGQYRPDLMENLSDQMNVGLCGFWVGLADCKVPKGRYRVGMAVKNRVTGLRLKNNSNCYLNLE